MLNLPGEAFLEHGAGEDAGRVGRVVDEELDGVVEVVGAEGDGGGGDEAVGEGAEVGDGALPRARRRVAREGRRQQPLVDQPVEAHQVRLLVAFGGRDAEGDRLQDGLRLRLGRRQEAVALRQLVPIG